MNCASARCSRATSPFISDEAAAGDLGGGAKSSLPSASPTSTWSLTGKSNLRGSPHCRTTTLSSADAHRHRFVRQVRDSRQQVLEAVLQPHQLLLGLLQQRLQLLALRASAPRRPGPWPSPGRCPWRSGFARPAPPAPRTAAVCASPRSARTARRRTRPGRARRGAWRSPAGSCAAAGCRSFLVSSARSTFSRIFASRPRSVGRYHSTAGMPSGK